MLSKKQKHKTVATTQSSQVTQTTQTRIVQHTQTATRRISSVSPLGNTFSNTNFPFATNTVRYDAQLSVQPNINLNYRSPYRNSFAFSSVRSKPTGIYQQPATGSSLNPLPTTTYHEETKKKIQVKKTGILYDERCIIPTYQTHSKNRGEVLIINNIMFGDKKERHGAKKDHENLESLFKQMGFKITLAKDLKGNQMHQEVKKFSQKRALKDVDIAVVVVMSHGTKNETIGGTEIFGLDDKPVNVDDLMNNFTESKCKHLIGKPKIFIYQCCRGTNQQIKIVQSDAACVKPADSLTDALIAYSTLPGFVSHRSPEVGTWYISSLCEVFSQHAHEYHVEDLLKMVDVKISNLDKDTRQTTHYESRGFKRCYFHPK